MSRPEADSENNVSRERQPRRGVYLFFCVYFIVINAHLLRNVSAAYVALPLALSLLLLLDLSVFGRVKPTLILRIAGVFWGAALLIIPYSLFFSGLSDVLIGAGRLLFVSPVFLFGAAYLRSTRQIEGVLKLYCWIVAIGAISIFYQIFFGTISWFANPGERGELIRYSSALGSLTIFGLAGGYALALLPWLSFSRSVKWFLGAAIAVGMIASLQKAAVVNLFLCSAIYLCFAVARRGGGRAIAKVILLYSLTALVAWIVLPEYFFSTADNIFRYSGESHADKALSAGVVERIEDKPQYLFNLYGISGFIWGVGVKGGAGTLGLRDLPIAHNAVFDLFFIGGVAYAVCFFSLLWVIGMQLLRIFSIRARLPEAEMRLLAAFISFFLVYTINFPFSSGVLYQPAQGGIFWICVGALSQLNWVGKARLAQRSPLARVIQS